MLQLFVYSKQTAKLIPPLVSRQYKPQQWLESVQDQFQRKAQHMTVKNAQDAFTGYTILSSNHCCYHTCMYMSIYRYCNEIANVWLKILSCHGIASWLNFLHECI